VAVSASGFLVGGAERTAPPVVAEATPVPVPAVFKPREMTIPKIHMAAPIVEVGVESDGKMGSPGNGTDIGWWPGVKPGEGNALFDAHHDWEGDHGSFYLLEKLEAGDEIVVSGRWETTTYRVEWVRQVAGDTPEAPDILAKGHKPVITLITCGGAFNTQTGHHVDRIVVRAVAA
jgi:LPXTG-site transpeptidase (sortase) family protein